MTEKSKYKIKAILFDLDGVIVDTAKYHYLAWKRLADEEQIYFDQIINEQLKGVSRLQSLEIILQSSEKKYTQSEKEDMASRKNGYYIELIQNIKSNEILPGSLEVLGLCHLKGIKTALCSSSKNARTILEKLSILGKFNTIVDGNEIRHSKPHPEVFLKAALRLNIPRAMCIVLEDAQAGIEAALRAGMHAVGVGSPLKLGKAEFIIRRLDDRKLVSFINSNL